MRENEEGKKRSWWREKDENIKKGVKVDKVEEDKEMRRDLKKRHKSFAESDGKENNRKKAKTNLSS